MSCCTPQDRAIRQRLLQNHRATWPKGDAARRAVQRQRADVLVALEHEWSSCGAQTHAQQQQQQSEILLWELDAVALGAPLALFEAARRAMSPVPPQLVVTAALHGRSDYLRKFLRPADRIEFFKHEELVRLVLRDAASRGDLDVLRVLFSEWTASAHLSEALVHAAQAGHDQAVAFLAELSGVDANAVAQARALLTSASVAHNSSDAAPAAARLQVDALSLQVLTNATLMAHIGSFQRDLHDNVAVLERLSTEHCGLDACDDVVGLLARMAIFCDDKQALGDVYALSRHPSRRTCAKFGFDSAMYEAAAEGNLPLLQFLHRCKDVPCGPSTMAVAATSGFAYIVAWLHEHRPESALSMSEYVLADVARFNEVDVLALCHTLCVGRFTPRVMDAAIANGKLAAVEWLYAHRTECCSVDAVAIALQTDDAMHLQVARFLFTASALDPQLEATLSRAMQQTTMSINALRQLIPVLIERVALRDLALKTAVRANAVDVVTALCGAQPSQVVTAHTVELALRAPHHLSNDAILSIVLSAGPAVAIDTASVYELLLLAMKAAKPVAVRLLVSLDDARGVTRTPDELLAMLQLASGNAVANAFFMHARYKFTKRIMLQHAPERIVPKLIRYLLCSETIARRLARNEPHVFAGVATRPCSPLRCGELEQLRATGDREVIACAATHAHQIVPASIYEIACESGSSIELVHFLKRELGVPVAESTMDAACAHGRRDVVQWLMEDDGRVRTVASATALRDAARMGHIDVLEYLHAHCEGAAAAVQSAVLIALSDADLMSPDVRLRVHTVAATLPVDDQMLITLAVQWGYVDIVRQLLSRMDKRPHGTSWVITAATHGHFDLVDLLLEHTEMDTRLSTIRPRFGWDPAGTLTKLIARLAERFDSVREELGRETAAATAVWPAAGPPTMMFGVSPFVFGTSVATTSRTTIANEGCPSD